MGNAQNPCHTEVSQVTEVSRHCEPCLHGVAIHNSSKVDCHAKSNDFLKKLHFACFARNDGSVKSCNERISPSLAEGD